MQSPFRVTERSVPLGALPALHARTDAGRPAVTFGNRTLTHAQLDAGANRKARNMALHGVRKDDRVAVVLGHGFEFFETLQGIWKLGATPVVMSAHAPAAELGPLLQLAEPRLVVASRPDRVTGCRSLSPEALNDGASAEPLEPLVPTFWKGVTSGGSTGRPKIIIDHMPGRWDPELTWGRQRPGDTIVNPGPLHHNAPFLAVHSCLFTGGHVVDMEKFEPLEVLQLIDAHRAAWILLVPTMMHRISRLPREQRARFRLSYLHTVLHLASACPRWLKREWIEWLGAERIYEIYAATERQGRTAIDGHEWLDHPGSVGRPLDCRMRILDSDRRTCPPGEIGEIYFLPDTGPGSTYHYLGASPTRNDEGYESVGDLGRIDHEGYLYLEDRRTDLIVSGGANVYPAEVEAALSQHPDVLSCAVIGLADDDLGQLVHAIVQRDAHASAGADELRSHLEPLISRYKIPRSFEFVDTPLRDDSGKTRRFELRRAREKAGTHTVAIGH